MAKKITDELVLYYFFRDADHLPSGIRIVSLELKPGTASLRSCELEKNGLKFRVGDWVPESSEALALSEVAAWTAIAARTFYSETRDQK